MVSIVKKKLKQYLSDEAIIRIKHIIELFKLPLYMLRRILSILTQRTKIARLSKGSEGLRLHLGCGDQHIEGMLNCEYRATKAADVVMDCGNLSRFKSNSVSLIFSNAFFEHLYRRQQIPLLKDAYRILKENGCLVFMMIPDFQVIAESYLDRVPGYPGRSDLFDLYQVYRNTHGDPDMFPHYWTEQLHKSLFDKQSIQELLALSGFDHWAIFNYRYPGENIPLNLGFVAWKNKPLLPMEQELKKLFTLFANYFESIEEPLQSNRLTMSEI